MKRRSVDAQSFQLRLESLPRHTEYCGPHPSQPTLDPMRRAGTLIIVFSRVVRSAANAALGWTAASMASESRTATLPRLDRARPPLPVTRSSCCGYDVGGRPRIRQVLNLQCRSCGRHSARAGKRCRCTGAMNGAGLINETTGHIMNRKSGDSRLPTSSKRRNCSW